MSFKDLKSRSNTSNIEILSKKAAEIESRATFVDERFWNITKGKDGNGSALIRFLPAPDGEELCWARYFEHRIKNEQTGKFYSATSPSTFGRPCPVSELNRKLWSSGEKVKQQFVSNVTKRREVYVFNIYVIKDPGAPENEGKVFL